MGNSNKCRWMSMVALVGAVCVAVWVVAGRTEAMSPAAVMLASAVMAQTPSEYEMPLCTDITKVLVQPGYIVTATTTDPNQRRADLRTPGQREGGRHPEGR